MKLLLIDDHYWVHSIGEGRVGHGVRLVSAATAKHPLLKFDEVKALRAIACHAAAGTIVVGENKALPSRLLVMPWGTTPRRGA